MINLYHTYFIEPALKTKKLTIDKYSMHETEIITFILSVLNWKKYNGKAFLITDELFLKYLNNIGIDKNTLWDDIIISNNKPPKSVNQTKFWASSKIYGLKDLKTPFVLTDMDVIFRKNFEKEENDFVFAHYEDIIFPVYVKPEHLIKKEGIFDKYSFKWDKFAINASLFYFNNQNFLDEYIEKACEFMEYSKHADYFEEYSTSPHIMVFIEQRFLGELMAYYIRTEENFKVDSIIKDIYVFEKSGKFYPNTNGESNVKETEKYMEHLWGRKFELMVNYNEYINYMMPKLFEIHEIFPEFYETALNIIRNAMFDKIEINRKK